MNYAFRLGVMLTLCLGTAEEEINENCIPYGHYCVTSSLPCCRKKKTENGCVRYLKTTCDFMLRTCNTFDRIYKFNETFAFMRRHESNIDLDVLYEKWLESLE